MNGNGGHLTKGLFSMDAYDDAVFEGWTRGDTWNGWQCPMFERPAAGPIVEATLRMWGDLAHDADAVEQRALVAAWHDEANDTYYFREDPETNPDDVIVCRGYDVVGPEGQTLHLYNIGTHGWCWENAVTSIA